MEILGSRHLRSRKIVNLSGSSVKVGRKTYPAAKAATSSVRMETGAEKKVPGRVPGKLVIVTKEVAEKNPDRDDLVYIVQKNGRSRFCTAWRFFSRRRRLPSERELKYSFWAALLSKASRSRHLVDSIGLSRLESLRRSSRSELKAVRDMALFFVLSKNIPAEMRAIARSLDPAAAFAARLKQLKKEARTRSENYRIVDHNTDASVSVRETVAENGERVTTAVARDERTGESYRTTGGTFEHARTTVAAMVQDADDSRSARENALVASVTDKPDRGERPGRDPRSEKVKADMARQRAAVMER